MGTKQDAQSSDVPKRDKVAIVGFTPSRKYAPWDDESWEIWGLNALFKYPDCKRFTRWFDLHNFDRIPDERFDAYAKMPIPVYLQRQHPKIPNSVEFPRERLKEVLGSDYWTNSISWMVGLAIAENFRAIHVYGVDMAQDTEYRFQRPNLEYWLGVARGMGRETFVPKTSDLLAATHEYGFGDDHGLRAKLKERLSDLQQRIQGIDHQVAQMQQQRHVLEGARQAHTWHLQSLTVPDSDSMDPFHPDEPEEAKE